MGNRMGRVKLRINSMRVFRNCRNCPSRAATRAISAISENTSAINPLFYEVTCDYLFITCRAKFLSKLGISKSSPFFTSKNTRSLETAKFSVVA